MLRKIVYTTMHSTGCLISQTMHNFVLTNNQTKILIFKFTPKFYVLKLVDSKHQHGLV